MSFQEIGDAIIQFVQHNQAWAAPVVFALAFAESLAFLSLVVPATFVLLGIAGLLSVSGVSFWPIVIAGWLGSSLGYSLSYWIGLYFKDTIHNYWPFTTHPYLLPRGRQFFEKFGVLGVFLGHFFGPVRAVVPVVAGMFAMGQLKFQLANLSSSLIWAVAVLSPAILGVELMIKIVAVAALILVLALLGAWTMQRRLMYFPDASRPAPAASDLKSVREVELATGDGNTLVCWYAEAASNQPTLLYFHGNAGNLASRSGRFAAYIAEGYGMFMMSYRGYNGSTGKPTESANIADAQRAYDYLRNEGVPADRIIIYGESLGTGVAVQVAASKPVAAVILDSPYTSMVEAATHHYPFIPVSLLLLDRYDTLHHIKRVRVPLLTLHGERDDVIPVEMGRRVFAEANEPKKLLTFPEGNHIDHWQHGSYDAIFQWLRSLPAKAKP